jgi:hypothetical protein
VDIAKIIAAIADNRIRITDHADEEAQADDLSFDEIFGSVFRGEVIEDYQDDWPYPIIDPIQIDGSTGVSGDRHDAFQAVPGVWWRDGGEAS